MAPPKGYSLWRMRTVSARSSSRRADAAVLFLPFKVVEGYLVEGIAWRATICITPSVRPIPAAGCSFRSDTDYTV